MKLWTVLLLYPDYLSDNYGQETYTDFNKANTSDEALTIARKKACEANGVEDPEDFFPLGIFAGHQKNYA